jgi:hypothetical protein
MLISFKVRVKLSEALLRAFLEVSIKAKRAGEREGGIVDQKEMKRDSEAAGRK